MPLKCGQQNCSSSFRNLFNLVRHLNAYHSNDEDNIKQAPQPEPTVHVTDNDLHVINEQLIHSAGMLSCLLTLQDEASSMVASLRSNSGVPGSVVPGIVMSVNNMIDLVVSDVSREMLNILVENGG